MTKLQLSGLMATLGQFAPGIHETPEVVLKFRPYAVAVAILVTAALDIAMLAPANAAATDPVTNLTVSQAQVGGSDHVTATWTPNDSATTYRAFITDNADGTSGAVLAFLDTAASSATISTAGLAANTQYWVAVKAIAPSAGTVTTTAFNAIPLDTTGPAGTFTLDHTSGYLALDFNSDSFALTSVFRISLSTLSDDTTPAGSITRSVVAGDGSAAKPWTGGLPFKVTYTKAGTFTPHVLMTDQFGNTTDQPLPTITVRRDLSAPTNRITTPANPTRIASWKVIRGTVHDTGTGVQEAVTMVLEKHGSFWYAYDFHKRKWLKGYTSMSKTLHRSKAEPAFMVPSASGAWHTPAIRGLGRGTLHVEAVAIDGAFNVGLAPKVTRKIH